MAEQGGPELPLHDEAKARARWRGGGAGPDPAGGESKDEAAEGALLEDLAQKPPD